MRCDCDWCPNIPNDWKQVRLKDIAILKSGDSFTADELSDDEENYPVYGGNGLRGYTEKYNKDGDYVLIGRQGALCGNINYAHGKFFATEHALVVNTYKKLNTTWLGETLRCADYNRLSQSAAQPGLAASVLMNQFIPFPPEVVRERIGSYLDDKTAKIDRAVSLLQKKRDAYTRLKTSIINRAVTRGLNTNVKLKDSGVEWIGMIPENWEVRRIKDIASNVFMGKTPEYCLEDNKNFIFGQRNNQVEGITFDGIKFGTDEFFKSRPKSEFLQYGDVLLNTLGGGSVGRTGYYNYRGENRVITDGHIMVIRSKVMDTRILYYFLSVRRRELENMAIGSTNQAFFNVSDIVTLFIPYPPTSEQHAIASYLDTHCSRIDHAISIVDKQIDAYTRLKKSLINEVVTGKRKV